jgi:ankyrin repeat protein
MELASAVAAGDYATSKRLIEEEQADVTKVDRLGRNLLCTAAYFGHAAIVELLLANPATDVDGANADGWTPLNVACCNGFPCIVSMLVEAGADLSKTNTYGYRKPIEIAQAYEQEAIVELLTEMQRAAEEAAEVKRRHLQEKRRHLQEKHRRLLVCLHQRASRHRAKNKALLNKRSLVTSVCDVRRATDRDSTAQEFARHDKSLLQAAERNDVAAVKALLGQGGDANEMTSTGVTALMKAAHSGHLAVVEELLQQGEYI